MWPELVAIPSVGLHDVVQLPEAEAEEVIETLMLEAPGPRLAETIGDGSPVGRQNRATVFPLEVRVELRQW